MTSLNKLTQTDRQKDTGMYRETCASKILADIIHNSVGSSRVFWVDHVHSLHQHCPAPAMLHVESGDLIDSSPKFHIAANPLRIPCKLAVILAATGATVVACRHLDELLSGGGVSPSKI